MNTGIIRGEVITNDNKAGAGVIALLKGTSKGRVTDDSVECEFRCLLPGTYTLQVSYVGYETLESVQRPEADRITNVNLQLKISDRQLQEVIVAGGTNRLARKQSAYVARMPLSNLENPQTCTVVNKVLLEEQVVANVSDVLKNAPGVDTLWTSTGRGGRGRLLFPPRCCRASVPDQRHRRASQRRP